MNPSFRIERKQYLPTETGNAGNGSNVNTPTIPKQKFGTRTPNLNPSFRSTPYNNNAISYNFPLYANKSNIYNKRLTNSIGKSSFGSNGLGNTGLAGNGNNQNGAGYRPLKKTPYKVNSLGAISGISQSFPYNRNGLYPDGLMQMSRPAYTQVNEGLQEGIGQGVNIVGASTRGIRTRHGGPPQPPYESIEPSDRILSDTIARREKKNRRRNDINMRRQEIKLYA